MNPMIRLIIFQINDTIFLFDIGNISRSGERGVGVGENQVQISRLDFDMSQKDCKCQQTPRRFYRS